MDANAAAPRSAAHYEIYQESPLKSNGRSGVRGELLLTRPRNDAIIVSQACTLISRISSQKRGQSISREYRINDRIRAREVRLIGDAGEQLGTVPLYQALQMAQEQGLDLVEVAPSAVPPVCRLLDYGKFKYEQAKKEREAKKHQKNVLLREIRMKPKIDDHDVDFKARTAEKLLKEGDKVKITVMFRGREITHPQIGRDLLEHVYGRLKSIATVEKPANMEGRHMTMILAPGAPKSERQARPAVAAPAAAPVATPAEPSGDGQQETT